MTQGDGSQGIGRQHCKSTDDVEVYIKNELVTPFVVMNSLSTGNARRGF